jgi:hypothetical protein
LVPILAASFTALFFPVAELAKGNLFSTLDVLAQVEFHIMLGAHSCRYDAKVALWICHVILCLVPESGLSWRVPLADA